MENEKPQKKPQTKIWKRVKVVDSYEQATALKTKLLCESDSGLEVKIRRYGPGGDRFQIKTFSTEPSKKKGKKKRK